MSNIKKGSFVEGGQAICILIVMMAAGKGFLGDYFSEFLKGFLPMMFLISALAYLFYKLELE